MDEILKAIQQLENRMNDKFEKIDEKFDKIDGKFDKIDERFDTMEGKMEQMVGQLDRMENTLNIVARTANDDTVAILKRIDNNTQSITKDIEYLSEQIGKHEMYFHRINEK
ncbi:hypothetical protein WMO40_08975 [Bacillaceae bacterium CLA-AA-H227]|uniref:Uncharacterized protein n=1 Tax=Robertmurraya yapensis (ex Hitch et al 2024) TaxID=3133160 RepID=A0ACC6SA09_9BACI